MKRRQEDSTRSLFTAGLLGIMNACIMFLPLAGETQAKLAAALNPTIALLAFAVARMYDNRKENKR